MSDFDGPLPRGYEGLGHVEPPHLPHEEPIPVGPIQWPPTVSPPAQRRHPHRPRHQEITMDPIDVRPRHQEITMDPVTVPAPHRPRHQEITFPDEQVPAPHRPHAHPHHPHHSRPARQRPVHDYTAPPATVGRPVPTNAEVDAASRVPAWMQGGASNPFDGLY